MNRQKPPTIRVTLGPPMTAQQAREFSIATDLLLAGIVRQVMDRRKKKENGTTGSKR